MSPNVVDLRLARLDAELQRGGMYEIVCDDCGFIIGRRRRSVPDHRRLFALIRKAFLHWPASHSMQFGTEMAFRSWLLIQAGHFVVHFVPYPEFPFDTASTWARPFMEPLKKLFKLVIETTITVFDGQKGYSETRFTAAGIEILRPTSLSFQNVDQTRFGEIRDAIENTIETAIGADAQQLLDATAA